MTANELIQECYVNDDMCNFIDLERLAQAGIKQYPDDARFYGLLARAKHIMEEPPEAYAEDLKQAFARDANCAAAWQVTAYELLANDDVDAALRVIDNALAHNPDDYMLLMARAWIHKTAGDIEDAITDWQRAVEQAPHLTRMRANLATHLQQLERFEEAEYWWKSTLEVQPDNGEHAYNLGTFLHDRERYEEAQPYFDKGRELLGPQNAIQHNRALNLKELGRYNDAIAEWNALLAREPQWHWPLEGVMDSYIRLKQFDDAQRYAKRLDTVLGAYEGQLLMAEECYREAEYEMALAVLQALPIGSYAEDARVWYWLGWLYLDAEKYKEAISYLQKAVQFDDEREHAFFGLAKALFKSERFEEALVAVNRAIELDSNDERYPDLHVQILLNLGQWSEMLAASDALIAERGNEEYAHSMRAIALKQLGRYKEAAAEYRIVASICDDEDDTDGAEKARARAAQCDASAKSNGFIAKVLALFGIK